MPVRDGMKMAGQRDAISTDCSELPQDLLPSSGQAPFYSAQMAPARSHMSPGCPSLLNKTGVGPGFLWGQWHSASCERQHRCLEHYFIQPGILQGMGQEH